MKKSERTILLIILLLVIWIFFQAHNFNDKCQNEKSDLLVQSSGEKQSSRIYFITPTYFRPVQEAELTRIAHTLLLVPDIHWILVEDSPVKTTFMVEFLRRIFQRKIHYNFDYSHLNAQTPQSFQTNQKDPNWLKPRGVWQRNEALKWLRENLTSPSNGVVYFGDDDNTYDLELFEEIRNTEKVSMFPVGLVGGLMVEKPLVKNGKVVGFNSMWKPKRTYPIDMSGFAVNLKLILQRQNVYFSPYVPRGYQETHLLTQLIDSIDELEPKANSCTKVLVWHTRTERPKLRYHTRSKKPMV